MSLARTAGRQGRPWRRLHDQILAESDVCCWCGHPGSRAVNHDEPYSLARHLAMDRDNLSPIHGVEGCDYCPWRWSHKLRRMAPRVCNSEVGARPLREALAQQAQLSRDW